MKLFDVFVMEIRRPDVYSQLIAARHSTPCTYLAAQGSPWLSLDLQESRPSVDRSGARDTDARLLPCTNCGYPQLDDNDPDISSLAVHTLHMLRAIIQGCPSQIVITTNSNEILDFRFRA